MVNLQHGVAAGIKTTNQLTVQTLLKKQSLERRSSLPIGPVKIASLTETPKRTLLSRALRHLQSSPPRPQALQVKGHHRLLRL